jgi:hypothetical protein
MRKPLINFADIYVSVRLVTATLLPELPANDMIYDSHMNLKLTHEQKLPDVLQPSM